MSVATVEAVDGADVVATLAAADALGVAHVDPMAWAFRELVAYAQVMTWSGWSPDFVGTASGSELVMLLESIYAAVGDQVGDLPRAVIITGSGEKPYGLVWGHFAPDRWRDALAEGKPIELFFSGELMAAGAVKTMTTVLHEIAHVLAWVRDVKDTSRQNRYHNRRFVEIAETLGLEYAHAAPHPTIGYSDVSLTAEGRARWSNEIAAIHRAVTLSMALPWWLTLTGGGTTTGGGGNGGHGLRGPSGGRGKGTGGSSNLKVTCPECGAIARASRSTLARRDLACVHHEDDGTVTYHVMTQD